MSILSVRILKSLRWKKSSGRYTAAFSRFGNGGPLDAMDHPGYAQARRKLSRELGHRRIDVTYHYVPRQA